ncbi:class I SAM-dependent methyltransferase, partial [Nostoc sp. NIES-2111]
MPSAVHKVACDGCGLIRNREALHQVDASEFYSTNYALNTSKGEEHQFFVGGIPIPRSKVVFDWIADLLPRHFTSILEIGCGEGNVLARFREGYQGVQLAGIEGSEPAAAIARTKGLDVSTGLVLPGQPSLPKADVVFSYGVLEHVEDVNYFLDVVRAACGSDGITIIGTPIMDEGGYDIFFADHVWHFHELHLVRLLENRGFQILDIRTRHPVNSGFALVSAKPSSSFHEVTPLAVSVSLTSLANERDRWLLNFESLNNKLEPLMGRPIAVYGAGEVMSLLMAYTRLGDCQIKVFFDEDSGKIGLTKHGITISHPNEETNY